MIGWCFNVSFPFIGNSFSNFRDFYFQLLVLLVYNIQINTPKTRESVRTIRVPDYVVDLIRAQGYVYDGHPNSINMYLTRLQKRLGLPHFSLHKFRHFFASTAREIMSDDYVEKIGGWKPGSPIMKKVYSYAKKKQEAAANEAYISKLSGLI